MSSLAVAAANPNVSQGGRWAASSSSGLRLLVADAPSPFLFEVDSGRSRRITGLATGGERGVSVVRLGRDALVLSARLCDRCSAQDVYLVRHGSTAAIPLGRGLQAVPSRDGRSVWMVVRRGAGGCAIWRVGVKRRVQRAARLISCRYGVIAELPAGLLLDYAGRLGSDPHNAILRPNGRIVRLPYQQAQPVVGNLVMTGSNRRTPMLLRDVGSGAHLRLRWPSRPDFGLGVVTGDPKDRRAVVNFAKYSPEHRLDLWLLNVAARHWWHLPGMPAHFIPKATDIEWTGDGRVVILSNRVLAVWRPGESRLTERRVRPATQPGSQFVIW